jgi:hypothetical protein
MEGGVEHAAAIPHEVVDALPDLCALCEVAASAVLPDKGAHELAELPSVEFGVACGGLGLPEIFDVL